ncbi:MAG: Calx-beta domain-containing protein [Thermoanaerobaculia bacterium]
MSRALVSFLLLLSFCAPAFAATHTWLGGTSELISDPSNWSGGAPAGDPDSVIVFGSSAFRKTIVNDVPGLEFDKLSFTEPGFTLSGEALSATDGRVYVSYLDTIIRCDIVITGTLTIGGDGQFEGAISGTGGVLLTGGSSGFSGNISNTYTGGTVFRGALLWARKTGGAIAIPGDVVFQPWSSASHLTVVEREQIADTATIDVSAAGGLSLRANEKIGVLIGGFSGSAGTTLTVDTIRASGQLTLHSNLVVTGLVEAPAGSILRLFSLNGTTSGLTFRGGGSVFVERDTTTPFMIDGVALRLKTPSSPVTMISGHVSGTVRSLVATGGAVEALNSQTDIHLGPAVTVIVPFVADPIRLNGTLDLANAILDPRGTGPGEKVVIENASGAPVSGTFAGVPEGGTAANAYVVTYRGGTGNDVALTSLAKELASIALEVDPDPAIIGETAALTAVVTGNSGTPTGAVTFVRKTNGSVLGTATLMNGRAALTVVLTEKATSLTLRYSGDAIYANGDVDAFARAAYRTPVINSIDPASAERDSVVEVTIRGSSFVEGMTVHGPKIRPDAPTFISSTELRATFDLRNQTPGTLNVLLTGPDQDLRSNTVPFTVTPIFDPDAMITFETGAAVARATPGAKAAWIMSGYRQPMIIADDDGDGVTRWSMPFLEGANYGVIDMTNGRYDVRYRDAAHVPAALPFPDFAFASGPSGRVTHLILPRNDSFLTPDSPRFYVLWVRPGVGAWRAIVDDQRYEMDVFSGLVVVTVDRMIALDSAPVPSSFEVGDTVIALNFLRQTAFAGTLEPGFHDQSPGVLSAFLTDVRGYSGHGAVTLRVIRRNGAAGTASSRYSTVGITAQPGEHYTTTTGTVTFGPGETTKTIDVPLLSNGVYDGETIFHVHLSEPVGATLGSDTVFVVRVSDADPRPFVTFADPQQRHVPELDAPYMYPVDLVLTGTTRVPAVVAWSTAAQDGLVTFAPGERQKSLSILIPGDDAYTTHRPIEVSVRDRTDVSVDSTKLRILVEEDDLRQVSFGDVSVGEAAGAARVSFTAEPGPYSAIVHYETSGGTATSGSDYVATQGSLVFAPTETQKTITVPVVDDGIVEGDETFTVTLTTENVFLTAEIATVTIVDDEPTPRPSVSITGTTIVEGNEGMVYATFEVQLTEPSSMLVRVPYATEDGTAMAGADYQAVQDAIELEPGVTSGKIVIPVLGDQLDEVDETFSVVLKSALNAVIQEARAYAVIVDDDVARSRRRAVRP